MEQEDKPKKRSFQLQWYYKNKDKIAEKSRLRYIRNKHKNIVRCICGAYMNKYNMKAHLLTKKHNTIIKYIETTSEE